MPAQFEPLSFWHDGSVRFLLCDFIASPEGETLTLHRLEGEVSPVVQVRPPPAAFWATDLDVTLTDHRGRAFSRLVRAAELEAAAGNSGPIRRSARLVFELGPLRVCLRVSSSPTLSMCRVEVMLHNPRAAKHRGGLWDLGDPGSVLFSDLSVTVPTPGDGGAARPELRVSNGGPFEVVDTLEFFQASSGGERWDASTHLDRDGRMPLAFRGGRCGDLNGDRASPEVDVGGLRVSVFECWQNAPKARARADGGFG